MTDPVGRLGAAERRTQLLGAARKTFGTEGYTATSMNDVAEAAGVTKPVLYQHFDSKQELFLELLTDTAEQLTAAVGAAVEASATGREKIEKGFLAYVSFFADTPTNYQVFYGEGVRTDPEFAQAHQGFDDSIHSFVAEHIDIDTLDTDHKTLAATAIAGSLEAVVGQWIASGQRQTSEEVASLLSSLAWRGLRGTS